MASVNRVILIGNLGRDPEIRYTQGGETIANFSLATSERWTGKDGQKQERTEWHRVEVFGKTAQVVRDYCQKGKQVYIQAQHDQDPRERPPVPPGPSGQPGRRRPGGPGRRGRARGSREGAGGAARRRLPGLGRRRSVLE
ncbi:MAG: single-stranded DNA-binding protein [Acidobacteria bacterium]|nr:MAG: single-stranded DNA-binding protein [Acidobacteriota bacterium]